MNYLGKAVALRQTLIKQAQYPLVMDEVIKIADPLFVASIIGCLNLAPASKINKKGVRDLLAMSLNREVKNVICLSARSLRDQQTQVVTDVRNTFEISGSPEFIQRSVNGWANCTLDDIEPTIRQVNDNGKLADLIWTGLASEIAKLLDAICGQQLGKSLSLGIWSCLCRCFDAAITCSKKEMRIQTPLIRLMPAMIPLGYCVGQTDTWVVLTA
ncbi:MAG: hypothetical protein WCT10_03050 [Patescibacteria group bacterium]|jgi:hypothetical protein